MLVIRREQMDLFRQAQIAQFENRMRQHLRSVFPAYTTAINDDDLVDLIRTGIVKSQHYGMTMEWDIRRFLEFSVLHGWEFDVNPETKWVTAILVDDTLNPREKMDKIEQRDNG